MTIEQEKELKELFEKYKYKWGLIWNPNEDTAKVVISITKRPKDDESGLCANFSNGEYVSLDGCEVEEFAIIHRLISYKG